MIKFTLNGGAIFFMIKFTWYYILQSRFHVKVYFKCYIVWPCFLWSSLLDVMLWNHVFMIKFTWCYVVEPCFHDQVYLMLCCGTMFPWSSLLDVMLWNHVSMIKSTWCYVVEPCFHDQVYLMLYCGTIFPWSSLLNCSYVTMFPWSSLLDVMLWNHVSMIKFTWCYVVEPCFHER